MSSNLTRRMVVAAAGIPLVVGLIYWGPWPLAILVAVLGALGAREVYGFARESGIEAFARWGYVGAALLPLYAAWAVPQGIAAAPAGVFGGAAWLMGLLIIAAHRGPDGQPVTAIGVTCLGALYAGGLPAFIVVLRSAPLAGGDRVAATALVLFPLVLTWLLDTFAMIGGSIFGGPKLAPVLSPKKTWSGALVGGAIAVILAPLYGRFVLGRLGLVLAVEQSLVIGFAIAVVAQVGDLAESLLKRGAGRKDSSGLIPGHGGVLDRLDSLYFVLPVTTGLLFWFGGT